MIRFSFSSLRVRLMLLVLLAVIPALVLVLYTASEDRRREKANVQQNTLQLTRLASGNQERLIEEGRHLLIGLAQIPAVRSCNSDACNRLFAAMLKQFPRYANLGAVDPNGNIFCSAVPLSRPINIGDRPGIKRTIQTRDFTVGTYQIGLIVRKPILSLNYPALDASGHLQAVVYATLDLTWFNQFAADANIPPGSTLTVIDSNGIILVHHPNPEKWVGKPMSEAPLVKTILNQQTGGTTEIVGLDDVPRLYAFTPLRKATEAGGYLAIGIPTQIAFAEVNRILTRNLIWLGLVTVLALIAAWVFGDIFFVRQVNALLRMTQRLAAGDLKARSGLPFGEGEFGKLARAFDEMAGALEQYEVERKRSEEMLREERDKAHRYLDIAGVILVVINAKQEVTLINKKGCEVLGYSDDEIIGKNWFDNFVPGRIRDKVKTTFAKLMAGDIESVEYFENPVLTKSGEERIIAWHNTVLKDYNGKIIGTLSSGEDITERKRAEENIRIYQEQLRSLASELALIEEQERRRIATDLHDHIGQTLAIAQIKLGVLQKLASSTDLVSSLDEIHKLIDQTIQYTRSLTFELSPPILYELGLEAALEWLAEQIQERHDIPVNFEDDRQSKLLSEEIRISLFKAVKELLINIVKHAKANQAKVSIRRDGHNIKIIVEDDGVGFSLPEDKLLGKIGGYGLFSIRERFKHRGGLIEIESKPGQGTRVTLVAPLEHDT
jgi:PAS domain S-box-containing protein